MGKNRQQSGLVNVITYDTNNNVSLISSPSSSIQTSGSVVATSITGSFTGSVFGIGNTATFSSSVNSRVSAIETVTASNLNRLTSLENKTGSLASTGSNTFYGTQIISGTTWIAGDFIVQGSSSIQYISASSVSIGTNIVQLNTDTPAVRYAGITVQDSGSSAGVTGSMLWDSLCNRWIYSNPSTIGYSGGMLMSGPRAANLGEETTLTCNFVAKSGGGDHLYDSCIYQSGSISCINTNLTYLNGKVAINNTDIVGSLTVAGGNHDNAFIGNSACAGIVIDGAGYNNNIVQIGLGYRSNAVTYQPSIIGFTTTDAGGGTKGDLVFATRNVTTDTAPSIKFRIGADGVTTVACRLCTNTLSVTGVTTLCSNLLISETTGTALGLYNNGSLRVCLGMTGNEGEISAYRSDGSKNVYLSSYYDSYITGPGKFGIGCTSPTYHLEVRCAASTSACYLAAMFARSTGAADGIGDIIAFGANGVSSIAGIYRASAGSWGLELQTANQNSRMRIDNTGITNFYCQVCIPRLYVENNLSQASIFRQTDASGYSSLRLYNDQGSGTRALEIDYMGSSYSGGERAEIFVTGAYPLLLGTSNTCRMLISNTGITSFTCQTCSPQFITTQGSSLSYTTGTNYIVWNSEAESCIQDSNNPAAYTRIKTWIADRSGCATIRFNGYIASGPTYWGYRVTRNNSSSYICAGYSEYGQAGCASPYVHGYSNYEFNIGPFLPGDCIGLDVVSTGGGATPAVGQGQYIFAKEFRVLSSTPNLSAGTASNVFGEWVGLGTSQPLSNLEIRGNNAAAYDCTVDNGQDGCGVTLTVRNGSTVTNSFSQINMQVSGDSGRALGRIVTIRKDSASSHMAFVVETANTKKEIMRIGCYGASSHNFLMVGRATAGISQGDAGITLNANTGQIESVVVADDILNLNRKSTDGKIIRLFKDSVEVGSISTNTNSLPSDINFKSNINNLDLGLNLVNKLRPVSYNYKLDDSGSALNTGFIAQEMECSLSELGVDKNKYFILQHKPVDDEKQSQYWLDYTKMIPVLTKAIQEQQCTINLLKSCIGIV
jgi:hypothetical protein